MTAERPRRCRCGEWLMCCWGMIRSSKTGTHTVETCNPEDVGTSNAYVVHER